MNILVDAHPVAIEAAQEAYVALSEMMTRGYQLKLSGIRIRATEENDIVEGIGASVNNQRLSISIPKSVPVGKVDEASLAWFSGTTDGVRSFAGSTLKDLIVHEMGHVLHKYPKRWDRNANAVPTPPKEVARAVSHYATENALEFVAETFNLLYNGERLPKAVMDQYREYGGPEVRQ